VVIEDNGKASTSVYIITHTLTHNISYMCNYKMGIICTRDLPFTYVLLKPKGWGYAYQANHECTCYVTLLVPLKCARSYCNWPWVTLRIVLCTPCDCGMYYCAGITFCVILHMINHLHNFKDYKLAILKYLINFQWILKRWVMLIN